MESQFLRRSYLLYLSLVALAAVSCRKHTAIEADTIPNGSGSSTPIVSGKLSGLKINGADCAFDSITNAYYYPVSSTVPLNGYQINFDTTDVKAIYLDGLKTANGAKLNATLQVNQQVIIKTTTNKDDAASYKLIIGGLPIVILTAGAAIGDDEIKADLKLIDPEHVSRNSPLQVTSAINIAIRGATSRAYPKKNYKVKTIDAAGADADVSLLGLRNDNSWILDAMYIDQGRMRNRVCTDLWNSFNNVPHIKSEPDALNGTRGYMTEVFLNGRYAGIYCLTEKLDRKQMKLKKQYGNSYKANLWTNETSFYGISPYDNTKDEWGGWELEYPELGDTPAPNWGYLSAVVNFIANASDDEFNAHIADKVDLPNLVDYFVFLNAMAMPDNENKNTFFSFYDSRNASKFYYSVWDMDGSLGRNAGGNKIPNQVIGASNNRLFDRLIQLDPHDFKAAVKARWNALKGNKLSPAAINERVENYRKQLVDTKAVDREKIVWTNMGQDLNTEAEYIKTWYTGQFNMIDKYFNGL